MISIYYTENEKLLKNDVILPDSWVHLITPTAEEIQYVYDALNVDIDFLRRHWTKERQVEFEDAYHVRFLHSDREVEGDGYVYNTIL
jgi:Mg2+ and Co2+ transporter CorA